MSNTQIPIYRAKKIGSDEWVEGYLDIQKSWETKCLSCGSLDTESHNENYTEECRCNNCGKDLYFHDDNWEHGYIGETQYLIRNNGEYTIVDPSTLAISFPDMLDKNKKRIFASLSEDGNGGDEVRNMQNDIRETVVLSGCCGIYQGINNVFIPFEDLDTRLFEVTGIHSTEKGLL